MERLSVGGLEIGKTLNLWHVETSDSKIICHGERLEIDRAIHKDEYSLKLINNKSITASFYISISSAEKIIKHFKLKSK